MENFNSNIVGHNNFLSPVILGKSTTLATDVALAIFQVAAAGLLFYNDN